MVYVLIQYNEKYSLYLNIRHRAPRDGVSEGETASGKRQWQMASGKWQVAVACGSGKQYSW